LKSCLGLFSYYRRFVENFSKIAAPLNELTKLSNKFIWNNSAQTSFDQLKTALTEAPVFAHFESNRKTEIRTDACDLGLSGILLQYQEKAKYPQVIEYASRSLSKCERNYPITEKELLAIVFAVYKFRTYIAGIHFTIVTDHHALCFIMKKPEISARLARWVLILQEFDFNITYRSGKKHLDADCISRFPLESTGKITRLI